MSSGLLNNGKISVTKSAPTKEQKQELSKKLERMRLDDREPVRGVFHYFEVPNGVLEFSFRKYGKDPVETYQLYDGQIYSLPKGVAKHLNTNVSYPEYEYIKGEEGKVMSGFNNMENRGMRINKKVRRCSFESLELIDMDTFDTHKKIIEVEQVIMRE